MAWTVFSGRFFLCRSGTDFIESETVGKGRTMDLQDNSLIRMIEVTIPDKQGFHMRPAARFVEFVRKYRSDILIRKGQKTADAKSILGLLALGASWNEMLQIEAVGGDAMQAIEGVKTFFSNAYS